MIDRVGQVWERVDRGVRLIVESREWRGDYTTDGSDHRAVCLCPLGGEDEWLIELPHEVLPDGRGSLERSGWRRIA